MKRCLRASGNSTTRLETSSSHGFGRLERHQVRLGKIAIIVRVFLGAHLFGDAGDVIPTAR